MSGDWKIKIVDVGYKFTRDIYIFRRLHNGKTEILGVGEIKDGDEPKEPTLELDPQQLQELANTLADNGFKPQKGFVEGKLQATEKHLSDLRHLLKLPKK